MARTEHDSWDLASSVGATATMVAAARALASAGPDPIIDDPYAADLVRAVGIDFFTRLVDGEVARPEVIGDRVADVTQMATALAVRTRFFDEFFTAACTAATRVRQAVILASGLDSRPYRLAWPPDTVVYEVDQPEVIEFKSRAMARLGAAPAAELRTVGIDLRDDWPAALRAAGFDPDAPAAFSAEGLLMYLPPEGQDRLLDAVTGLSAPGSRLATECYPDGGHGMGERAGALTEHWRQYGYDLDINELFYLGKRNDVVEYLQARGWRVHARPRSEFFAEYGQAIPDADLLGPFRTAVTVSAVRE